MTALRDIENKTALIALFVIIIITSVIYLQAINHEFVNWDDNKLIYDNYYVKNFSIDGFSVFIKAKIFLIHYDPLTLFSQAIVWYFFPNKPIAFILVNVLFHLFNIVLVYIFLRKLLKLNIAVVITTAFFAVHPLRVESVTWMSERKDVLYAFFFLLGMIMYLRYLEKKKLWIFVLVFALFVLSVFSKLSGFVFPAVLFLIDYFKKRNDLKRLFIEKLPFIIVSIMIFLLIKFSWEYQEINTSEAFQLSLINKILFGSYSILYYFFQFLFPYNLNVIHSFPDRINDIYPLQYYLSPFIVIILLCLIILLIKKNKHFAGILFFGIFFFAVNIILVLHIIPYSSIAIVAERYTYLAHIGLGIFISVAILSIYERLFYLKLLLFSCVFILFSFLTFNRVKVWKTSEILFTDAVNKNPDKSILYLKRGAAYNVKGNYFAALIDFEKAVFYKPESAAAHYQRGLARFRCNNIEAALNDFDFCIQKKRFLGNSFKYKGHIYMLVNQPINALNNWLEAYRNNDVESKKLIITYLKLY